MEFQRRGGSRGFGAEETFALQLEGTAELQLMKRVNKGIPEGSRGRSCQRKEARNHGTSTEQFSLT